MINSTRKRVLSAGLTLVWIISLFLPTLTAAQGSYDAQVDYDNDGLSNYVEVNGWCNNAGCFTTDPLDVDTDDDGLTDGEEKLYETDPTDAADPGIYVEYQDNFQTREYFHATNTTSPYSYLKWYEHGNRQLLKDALVIRRGTSFKIGGPLGANLSISKYNPAQTDLSVTEDFCQGGWQVSVPIDGSIGIYTATLSTGATMPIYVVFELPTVPASGVDRHGIPNITDADVSAFLYNDDPTDVRDTTSIWYKIREWKYDYTCADNPGQPCDDEPYHVSRGYAQGFDTQHFQKHVLIDLVLPYASGLTSQYDTVKALSNGADREVRVWYDGVHATMSSTLYRYFDGTGETQDGGACQDNANVLTGFLRSAGILAKPFMVDWLTGFVTGSGWHGEGAVGGWYDHQVMVWVNGEWMRSRSYGQEELYDPYYPWDEGNKNLEIRNSFYKAYSDVKGDQIISADGTWDWTMVATDYPVTEVDDPATRNINWDYLWDSRKPLEIRRNPSIETLDVPVWYGDSWTPDDFGPATYVLPDPYPGGDFTENWPQEPTAIACSPLIEGTCPFPLSAEPVPQEPDNVDAWQQINYGEVSVGDVDKGATLSNQYKLYAKDTNADSYADTLLVDAGLNISQSGVYTVSAEVYNAQGAWLGFAEARAAGSVARLTFPNVAGQPGPYQLRDVQVFGQYKGQIDFEKYADLPGIADLAIAGPVSLGARTATMSPFDASLLTFTPSTPDADGNGLFDNLTIAADVNVTTPGTYRIEGWLTGPAGELIAWTESASATLAAGNQTINLAFDGRAIAERGIDGPYTLTAVKILDGATGYTVLDEANETGLSMAYNAAQFDTATDVQTVFSDDMENGAGLWNTNFAGSVWTLMTGESVSPTHAWEGNAAAAQSGSIKTVSIDLSGYARPQLAFNACYQLAGANDTIAVETSTNGVDWTPILTDSNTSDPWHTPVLDLSAYAETPGVQVRFNASAQSSVMWHVDDVAVYGLPAVQSASFVYSPTTVIAHQPTVFTATYTSITDTLPITYTWDFGDGTPPVVTDTARVAHTFTSSADQLVQLTVENPYDSASQSTYIGSFQPVTGASFTFSPAVPVSGQTVTLTATVTPIDADTPITYTWDFGDGTVVESSSNNTTVSVVHTFANGGQYPVQLTADNLYGLQTDQQTIEVKQGISGVTFSIIPPSPLEDDTVSLFAEVSPATASSPITYTWDFGDGSSRATTTNSQVDHIFADVGVYTVMVTATNGYGAPASTSGPVTIDGRPVAQTAFTVAQAAGIDDHKAEFVAAFQPISATQPITHIWNFGTGVISETNSATITYRFPTTGTFTVQLTTTNGYGEATDSQNVEVPFDDDGDGLSNSAELTYGTSPTNPDTDDDGRTDGEEVFGYVYTGTVYTAHVDYGRVITTSPTTFDSDNDGFSDGQEFELGTHPNDTDTDDDGLDDSSEQGTGSTDPLIPDTDADGLLDGEELNTYGTNGRNPDTDNDTLSDGDEVNTYGTNPLSGDTDSDNLGDALEVNTLPTDPTLSDSDSDNVPDDVEVGGDVNNPLNTDNDTLINALDPDDDGDTISTLDEDVNGDNDPTNDDTDNDTIPNYLDPDDDGDGIPTVDEGTGDPDGDTVPNYLDDDSDGDGIADADEGTGDPDGDGIPNYLDDDSDGDGIPDADEGAGDPDGDGIPNYLDDDSDGDDIPDADEGTGDADGDTIPDYLDNDNAPQAIDDAYGVDEGGTLVVGVVTGLTNNDRDPDGDPITATIVSQPAHGSVILAASGAFTYTHDGGESAADSFTYRLVDSHLNASAVATVSLTINPVNDAPTAADDSFGLNEGAALVLDTLTDNDNDPENAALTVSIVTNPSHGTLAQNIDGSFTYTHDGGESTSDSFTYRVSDGLLSSNLATVSLTINPVNDAPVAVDDSGFAVDEAGTLTIVLAQSLLANDTDDEGDTLTATLAITPAHGSVTVNADGTFTYIHDGSETVTDTFTYQADDGNSLSNEATVSLTINPVNDAPVGQDDAYEVQTGQSLTVDVVDGVLSNDTDADNSNLTVTLVDTPAHGSLTLNADGSFTYTHNGDDATTDSFTYRASDGTDTSNLVTVTITITATAPGQQFVFLPLILNN